MTFEVTNAFVNESTMIQFITEAKKTNQRIISIERKKVNNLILKVYFIDKTVKATYYDVIAKSYIYTILNNLLTKHSNMKYFIFDVDKLTHIINTLNSI